MNKATFTAITNVGLLTAMLLYASQKDKLVNYPENHPVSKPN